MENKTTKVLHIGGNEYLVSASESMVLYADKWRKIETDKDGDLYIMFGDRIRFADGKVIIK